MNSKAAAASLGISIRTLRRYIAQGLPCDRSDAGELSFDPNEIREWVSKPHSKRKLKTYWIFDPNGRQAGQVSGSRAAFKALMLERAHNPFDSRSDSTAPYALDTGGRVYVAEQGKFRRHCPGVHRPIEQPS